MKKSVFLTSIALVSIVPAITMSIVSADSSVATSAQTFSSSNTSSIQSAAVAQYSYGGESIQIDPNNKTFQVSANSKFDPVNIVLSNGGVVKISDENPSNISVESNPVDTSKPGTYYTVKLSVAGKKISYTVFVKTDELYLLNTGDNGYLSEPNSNMKYIIKNYEFTNNKGYNSETNSVEAYVTDSGIVLRDKKFYQGDAYYIGDKLLYFNGKFYTAIYKNPNDNSDGKSILWIETRSLAKPILKLEHKTVMHKASIYSDLGKYKLRHINAFTDVYVNSNPVDWNNNLILDGKYYQIFTKEKDGNHYTYYTNDFIKKSNIDGTKRTLTRNAYIYATGTRKASNELLKKGTTVITYGGSYKFKNGKRYYRIEGATKTKKRYVKVANFK